MTHPLAALIADVPRYSFTGKKLQENGWMHEDAVLAALEAAPVPDQQETLQARVWPWMLACFGEEIARDREERGDRLLEEVFELLQSGGYDPARVLALRDYVWSREVGEPAQEVGGVMITLAAYCLAHDLDMDQAGETELARIWTKVEKIRAKQAAKPRGSALPQAWPPQPAAPVPDLVEAGKVVEHLYGPHEWGYRDIVVGGFVADEKPYRAADTITALIALATAQQSQIAGLTKELKEETALAEDMVDQVANLLPAVNREAVEQRARAESAIEDMKAAEAKLAEWQASQHYSYIGKDGKPVLARDLEARLEVVEAERDALRTERDAAKITQVWMAGEPPKHIRDEWFIAKTIHGDRVVLRALPEEWKYDYKTADETYMAAKNIAAWMQMPDSGYVSYVEGGAVTAEAVARAEAAEAKVAELEAQIAAQIAGLEGGIEAACRREAATERKLRAEAATLRDEVERLRGALTVIDAMDPEGQINGFSESALRGTVLHMGAVARAALEGKA